MHSIRREQGGGDADTHCYLSVAGAIDSSRTSTSKTKTLSQPSMSNLSTSPTVRGPSFCHPELVKLKLRYACLERNYEDVVKQNAEIADEMTKMAIELARYKNGNRIPWDEDEVDQGSLQLINYAMLDQAGIFWAKQPIIPPSETVSQPPPSPCNGKSNGATYVDSSGTLSGAPASAPTPTVATPEPEAEQPLTQQVQVVQSPSPAPAPAPAPAPEEFEFKRTPKRYSYVGLMKQERLTIDVAAKLIKMYVGKHRLSVQRRQAVQKYAP